MSRRPATFRQTDLARAIRAAKAAGMEVARIEVVPDGRIVIIAGLVDSPKADTEQEIVL